MSLKLKDLYVGTFSTCLLVSLLALIPAAAAAQTLGLNFNVPAQVSPTEAPFVWYPDRFSPSNFSVISGDILTESVAPAGFQTPTPSFYNTQGNKFDLVPGTNSVSIYVYVPSSWEVLPERLAGFWATAVNSSGVVGNDYPIIEFQGPINTEVAGPSYYPNGGVAGFYGWNNTANGGNGGWDSIPLPAGFKYNSWVKLTMALSGGSFTYTVTSAQLVSTSITSPLSDPTEAYLGNVILEAYNYDSAYTIKWKKLTFSFDSNSQIVWN